MLRKSPPIPPVTALRADLAMNLSRGRGALMAVPSVENGDYESTLSSADLTCKQILAKEAVGRTLTSAVHGKTRKAISAGVIAAIQIEAVSLLLRIVQESRPAGMKNGHKTIKKIYIGS
jgi:hypothetical protein